MKILKVRYGAKNCVINAHKKILMNEKVITDTIADFDILSNNLKIFHSVLLHYKVGSDYFSGKVVKDILDRHLTKSACKEFTN